MVVVDEKSRVPPIDEAALERLSHALDHDGVVAAMLIGSQARGTTGPLSDVDIAVWHDPNLDSRGRFDLPLLRHCAIRDGRRLVERDHDERVRLETRAILDYLDTAPLRAELGRGVRRRMEEGRFGRRKSS